MGTAYGTGSNSSKNFNESSTDNESDSNDIYGPTLQTYRYIKTRVNKIHIDGLKRTKDDIIKAQVSQLFKATNFLDAFLGAYKVRAKLQALGCFDNINIYMDVSHGPDAKPEDVEITFTVNELKHIMGRIDTMVGNNEGTITAEARAPNVFGRGERIQMEYSVSNKKSTAVNLSVVKPLVDSWLHTVLTASVFKTINDFPWSGYKLRDAGLLFDVALNPEKSDRLKHNFQYETTFREIAAAKQASFSVREQCGPCLKSALKHIFLLDKRDAKLFPTRGSLIQFSTEVAGLGGDIGFIKNELIMQSNWTPHEYFTFQLGVQSGLLRGISNDMKINIADHFFLGGPMNLRGFEMRGCGPRRDGNSLGGDLYWAVALHLYTPLPFRPRHILGDAFRLHGFINGGNLFNYTFKFGNSYKENMKIFTENIRCSVGGGIAMQLGNIARLELNLVTPLLYAKSDVLQQFQFGIGVQYL